MIGTCSACGTFVRGETCPHCGKRGLAPVVALSAAAVLLGLTAQACITIGQEEYGVMHTDVVHETGDTGDTDTE